MNKLEYEKRLKELLGKANAIRCQFTEGRYLNYLSAVREISEFKKRSSGKSSNQTCGPCQGTGKKKDSTGFFPLTCPDCKGTGIEDVLTIPEGQVTVSSVMSF